jgi:hypothetical protein
VLPLSNIGGKGVLVHCLFVHCIRHIFYVNSRKTGQSQNEPGLLQFEARTNMALISLGDNVLAPYKVLR